MAPQFLLSGLKRERLHYANRERRRKLDRRDRKTQIMIVLIALLIRQWDLLPAAALQLPPMIPIKQQRFPDPYHQTEEYL